MQFLLLVEKFGSSIYSIVPLLQETKVYFNNISQRFGSCRVGTKKMQFNPMYLDEYTRNMFPKAEEEMSGNDKAEGEMSGDMAEDNSIDPLAESNVEVEEDPLSIEEVSNPIKNEPDVAVLQVRLSRLNESAFKLLRNLKQDEVFLKEKRAFADEIHQDLSTISESIQQKIAEKE